MARATDEAEIGVLAHHVPLWDLFVAFSKISARGWGGGSGTIYTMLHELVRRKWITPGRFALDFGLSRMVPGINLLALSVMLGYRLNGVAGGLVAITALMLPASVLTVVLTAGFVYVAGNPIGEAAVKGAIAVTAALTFALAYENSGEIVPWRERRIALLVAGYAAASFFLVIAFQVSVAVIIVLGAVFGAAFLRPAESARGR